ncbi:MAG: HsmA family protein [Actinomycetota bacterium]|nr:HsmA family protein [Actinomycetota bacterium]MDZ4180566.1 HsmA family protein [Coriobacteriia bacterium]
MPQELIWPSVIMSLAFAFYTAGVWGERISRNLKGWHVSSFWLGLSFDAYGTLLMDRMRTEGIETDLFHSVTGASAFALMALHAAWATWVLARGSDTARRGFHRYSLVVWLLWLIPYFGGMLAGMAKGLGN